MNRPNASNLPRALRFGHVGILAFWLALGGVIWLALSIYVQPKAAVITAEGDLVIPRHRDGHFYVEGKVNGRPIHFLIDTGASSVVVSNDFARAAKLPQGEPTTFFTANGAIQGSTVRNIEVSAGPFSISSTTVGVGLVGGDADKGLLGQTFLSKFDMSVSRKELVLRKAGGKR